MEAEPRVLTREDGARIAYHFVAGEGPVVVFLGGFSSDMTGRKATCLDRFCRERGQAFLRFDYQGHGASSGDFAGGTVGGWAEDARTVIEAVSDGELVLVGSSMGGWIMLIVALALRRRVRGLVGIAAAPDFTERLMWERFDADQRATLMQEGAVFLPSRYDNGPYPITRRLIEEGRTHLLLDAPIDLHCPVRLLHGLEDPDVPWELSLRLGAAVVSDDVRICLVKGGDHRLSEPSDLGLLTSTVAELSRSAVPGTSTG